MDLKHIIGVGFGLLVAALLLCRRSRRCNVPLSVLIVGGSRGLGFKVAQLMCSQGHRVVVTSRKGEVAESVATLLGSELSPCLGGVALDVRDYQSVESAVVAASALLGGHIDVVVAMQGLTQKKSSPLKEVSASEMEDIVRTNLLGSMYVAKAALSLGGSVSHVVLVGGGGTRGTKTPSYAAYGATKSAFPQLMASLVAEEKAHSTGIHLITPGMTLTSLLMGGEDCASKDRQTRRIFNVLAEPPSVMAQWFVQKVVNLRGTGSTSSYLTPLSVLWRFIRYPLMANRLVDEETGAVLVKI